MNRVIFKESGKCNVFVDIVLYTLITVIGFIILFSNCLSNNILENLYAIFYVFAIISLVAYFINRRPYDYESLLFCLINVFVGTFALLNYKYFNEYVILSLCIFIHTVCNTANKWYHSCLLDEKNDPFVVSKASMTFLLAILGLFVSLSFYFRSLIEHEFLGYYIIAFGLLSLLEPFMRILIRNNTINKYLSHENKKVETTKTKVVTKEKVKPTVKIEKKVKQKVKTEKKKETKKKTTKITVKKSKK